MREIMEQGGGWKGAFGVPILRELHDRYGLADCYAGTSVGAINTAMAAQGKLRQAEAFWSGIHDDFPLDGIKGYLSFSLRGGLFSMKPIRKKLDAHLTRADLKRPLRVGVSRRSPFEYRELHVNAAASDEIARDYVQASAAIAFVMQPVVTVVDGEKWDARDGGHWQTLPHPLLGSTEVHAIVHHPLDLAAETPHERKNELVGELEWLVWSAFHAGHARDLGMLRAEAERGVKVHVWAPLRPLGGTLDSSAEALAMRTEEGEAAVRRGPVML